MASTDEEQLNLSISVSTASVRAAIQLLQLLLLILPDALVTLTRPGDRSGANLLLPKISGRTGLHFQNRREKLREIVSPK